MTNNEQSHNETMVNIERIRQTAEFYRLTLDAIADYQSMNCPALLKQSQKHLMHWKQELHRLIFNSAGGVA